MKACFICQILKLVFMELLVSDSSSIHFEDEIPFCFVFLIFRPAVCTFHCGIFTV